MDTTAKVDVRKLQLLNDRIAQTIDALNQVRLSVHGLGLSHTAGMMGGGIGQPFGAQLGQFGVPYPNVSPQVLAAMGMVPGLQHTSALGYGQVSPIFGQAPYAQQGIGGLGAQVPFGIGGGLMHTTPEAWMQQIYGQNQIGQVSPWNQLDPITAQRVVQSFPFAQLPISPLY